MNLDNEFDELARRKLQEQSFPFEEAHWQQAEQAIAAQRGRKRRGFWLLGAAALLMVGTTAWWTLNNAEADTALASTSTTDSTSPSTVEQHGAEKIEASSTTVSTSPSSGTATPAAATGNGTGATTTNGVTATPSSTVDATTTSAAIQTSSTKAGRNSSATSNAPQGDRMTAPKRTSTAVASVGTTGLSAPQSDANATTPNSSVPKSVDIGTITPVTTSGVPTPSLADATPASASSENPADPSPATIVEPSAVAIDSPTQYADTLDDHELITLLTAASETTPADSANPAAGTAALAVPPLIPDRAPWEISLLGGAFSSIGTYSGGNSAEWSGDISRETTPGFGAELMHLGRNIGIGLGLHYGTYAERIQVNAIDRTNIERWNFWYLMPVDTTILIITDTVQQGGQVVYEGVNVNTTVNVLTQGTDSSVTTVRVRDARQLVNRTSYLEVPLLFDAHLVQGRWSLGLRGGPTLGLLTGRTGSIPNSTNDGYTELGDQAFREVVFGWTARAYLRYRWNAAWSVGIEPAARGLFSNSLSEGDVQRRSSAFGGMISLSYRLR